MRPQSDPMRDERKSGCGDGDVDGAVKKSARDIHADDVAPTAVQSRVEASVSRGGAPTQTDALIELASSAELFLAPDGVAYADINVNGHRETCSLGSKGFKRWLTRRFFEKTGGAPAPGAMRMALDLIEARAQFDAPEREVFIRVAQCGDRLYLDLGDSTWRAVEIDPDGWRIVDRPPVRFCRACGMAALPAPVAGGSIEGLRSFLNVLSDDQFVLTVAWLLGCFRGRGYSVLVLSGEQGSAKSTLSRVLRALIDPNTAPLRALPRDDRDFFIAASNAHVLAFDNVSRLPNWTSDTLCRLATGGGFATRRLRTDHDEALFDASRPVIINGIEDMVTRPDLADRAIFLTLGPIADGRRRAEAQLWAEFEAARPYILGALLDAVALGLKRLPEIQLSETPRMADFAHWATACEQALWPAGRFMEAFKRNRAEAIEEVIDADVVASAVRKLMTTSTNWKGTASQLQAVLSTHQEGGIVRSKKWPGSSRELAGQLRRVQTFLRAIGIELSFGREGHVGTRMIEITRTATSLTADAAAQPLSASSASSAAGDEDQSG
jgi:hypothetical protein